MNDESCLLVRARAHDRCRNDERPAGSDAAAAPVQLLNVSYDPTRELYQEINQRFQAQWRERTGQAVQVNQSHGGSGKQARAVIDGLEADVVSLSTGYDLDAIAKAGLIPKGWPEKFANRSSPFVSTILFLVRRGNPQKIQDWSDLVKEGTSVITPNPKTGGGARVIYLAAWLYEARRTNQDEEKTKEFVRRLYKNVLVLDSGARGSTTTFAEREQGDVLLTWENEAYLALGEFGRERLEIVVSPVSVLADLPVAVVDRVVTRRGTRAISEAYLDFLYTEEAQEIGARHHYRPTLAKVLARHEDTFAKLTLVPLGEAFPDWQTIHAKHFADGGIFDQIYQSPTAK